MLAFQCHREGKSPDSVMVKFLAECMIICFVDFNVKVNSAVALGI